MKVLVKIDPSGENNEWTEQQIMAMCGCLPYWAAEAFMDGAEGGMKDALIQNYEYYLGPMTGGEVSEDGVYTYPEDPPMYPLLQIDGKREKCFIYHYGIVAVRTDKGNVWVTRMD